MKTKSPKTLAIAKFSKDYTAFKNYILGRGYQQTLKALAFAEQYHVGTRKDGYTPEFHHQISICWGIVNLRGIEDIEEYCLTLALLHDVMEDYDISFDVMAETFGDRVAEDVYLLSKKHRGEVKNLDVYHEELGNSPATIIVKGADNSHNVQTMHGAFSSEKITSYLTDTKKNKLPLLRLGRKRYPQYYFAFTGLSFMLKRQVELYEAHQKAIASLERIKRATVELAADTITKASTDLALEHANQALAANILALEHANGILAAFADS